MALTLVQAGTSLQLIHDDGSLQTLTLPTGVTLRTDVPPRWAIFGDYVVMVNTPEQPITIDQYGVVRLLCPRPPSSAPVLSSTNGGTLSGGFKSRITFREYDDNGELIWETDFSPTSNTLTITSKYITYASLETLVDSTTNGRGVYRTSNGTDVYFEAFGLDDNVATTALDDTSDAGIATFSAPARGTPPYLTHVAEFRGRLFGIGADEPDTLRYTEVGEMFAWPSDNFFPVPHVGSDQIGVTALIPRRDALGVVRQNVFLQFTGEDDDNFRLIKLSENTGCVSQESVVVYRDVAYFLWYDGVYKWDSEGIQCISDEKVRSWFNKDDTFDRTTFDSAFAGFDPNRKRYMLFATNVETGRINWIEYDIESGTWWGPHETEAYSLRSAFQLYSAGNQPRLCLGVTETKVVIEQETRADGPTHGIEVEAVLAPIFGESSDYLTLFGDTTILTKAQSTGGTMTVTPAVGEPGALVEKADVTVPLSTDRKRIGRIGAGRACTLTFTHDTIDEKLEIGGIEIPVSSLGRR